MAIKKYKNLRGVIFNIARGTGKPVIPVTNTNIVELESEIAEKYPSWFSEIEKEKHPNIGQSFDEFIKENQIPEAEELDVDVDLGEPIEETVDVSTISEITDEFVEEVTSEIAKSIDEEIVDESKEEFDTYENIMSIAEKIDDVKDLRELAENYGIKLDGRKQLKGSMTQFKKELVIRFEK